MRAMLRSFLLLALALALLAPSPGPAQAACTIQITPSKTFTNDWQSGSLDVDVSSLLCEWEVVSYPGWITYSPG